MSGRTRTEVRFSVYSKGASVNSTGNPLIYDLVNFDVGGLNNNYDTSTYKYTVPLDGIYLIGYSYIKLVTGPGRSALVITREGVNIDIQTTLRTDGTTSTTLTGCVVYKLLAGDILYLATRFGNPRVNLAAHTTDNVYNSFWGIRLDYDITI